MDVTPAYYCIIVKDCIEWNMNKEETMRYLHNEFLIPLHHILRAWNYLESTNPDLFIAYNARIRERNARMRDHHARIVAQLILNAREQQAQSPFRLPPAPRPFWNSPNYPSASPQVPREGTSAILGEQEQQHLSPPPPAPSRRLLLPDLNVRVASPQEANAVDPSSQAGPSRAANANATGNQNLQTSQQQPVFPNEFCEQALNALGQIQSNTQHLNTLGHIQSNTQHLNTLGQIQSNTDQMVKLLTHRHGFGPHPYAARSSKRQRVGEAEERGKNEEAEKLQEKEEGDDNEAEKLQDNERAGDEEAEKLQENERGDNEEEEKLQEKEEGNDGEAEKLQD
ncbi:hypothetical protein N665_0012s0176 [Sinapis alba]|nr:hypothetical protein N665_0012s0176 [Sinapis alba]